MGFMIMLLLTFNMLKMIFVLLIVGDLTVFPLGAQSKVVGFSFSDIFGSAAASGTLAGYNNTVFVVFTILLLAAALVFSIVVMVIRKLRGPTH